MDIGFVNKFGELFGRKIESVSCAEIKGYMLFELLAGDIRLCWEIAKPDFKGGRCFVMHKDEIDGAGVFPLHLAPAYAKSPDPGSRAKPAGGA